MWDAFIQWWNALDDTSKGIFAVLIGAVLIGSLLIAIFVIRMIVVKGLAALSFVREFPSLMRLEQLTRKLNRKLSGQDAVSAAAAARELVQLGSPDALDAIFSALTSTEPRIVSAAKHAVFSSSSALNTAISYAKKGIQMGRGTTLETTLAEVLMQDPVWVQDPDLFMVVSAQCYGTLVKTIQVWKDDSLISVITALTRATEASDSKSLLAFARAQTIVRALRKGGALDEEGFMELLKTDLCFGSLSNSWGWSFPEADKVSDPVLRATASFFESFANKGAWNELQRLVGILKPCYLGPAVTSLDKLFIDAAFPERYYNPVKGNSDTCHSARSIIAALLMANFDRIVGKMAWYLKEGYDASQALAKSNVYWGTSGMKVVTSGQAGARERGHRARILIDGVLTWLHTNGHTNQANLVKASIGHMLDTPITQSERDRYPMAFFGQV